MTMMTRRGKRRDWCCPGHNPKELDHGTERAREKREWSKDTMNDKHEHAGYPHHPGTLYDCDACRDECFCEDGFTCVHCAQESVCPGEPGYDHDPCMECVYDPARER